MKQNSSKLQHKQQEQTAAQEASLKTGAQEARAFQTSEEMLRFDAAQTLVPESVKLRLADSVAKEPHAKSQRPWWQRLFGN